MITTQRVRVLMACLFACIVLSFGCYAPETTQTTEPPLPIPINPNPPQIVVIAAGQCVPAGVHGIQCKDESKCTDDGVKKSCDNINWEVESATTGIQGASKNGKNDDTVNFSGLPADDYVVKQLTTFMEEEDTNTYPVTVVG